MKRIIVLGFGFGGLFTVLNLCKYSEGFLITVIGNKDYFTFTPLIHEVATAGIRENNAIYPVDCVLRDKRVEFVKALIKGINLNKKDVLTSNGKFNFDYLVIALGSGTIFHKIQGLKENCLELKDIEDARRIKKEIMEQFEKASKVNDKEKRKKFLTFVVIGAGPTGVELASEIKEFGDEICRRRFKNISVHEVMVIILQRGDRILKQLPEDLIVKVKERLNKIKVELRLNSEVKKVSKEGIYVNNEFVECDMKILTAGVTANKIKTEPNIYNNGIEVDNKLRVLNFENVFALGDVSLHKDKNGFETPKLAQAAVQEGEIVARNIVNSIRGRTLKDFNFKNKGFLLSVGQKYAAGLLALLILVAFVTTFKLGESMHVFGTLREIFVMNTGGGNTAVNFAYFGALLSLVFSGSKCCAVKPD